MNILLPSLDIKLLAGPAKRYFYTTGLETRNMEEELETLINGTNEIIKNHHEDSTKDGQSHNT